MTTANDLGYYYRSIVKAGVIDLATLNLAAWIEADEYLYFDLGFGNFLGTVLGKASAGGSGTHPNQDMTLNGTTNVPTVGPNLNGLPTIQFDRTKVQHLDGSFNSPFPLSTVVYSGWLLVFWSKTGMPNNAPSTGYNNAGFFSDSNLRWNIDGRNAATAKAQLVFYNGASFDGPEVDMVDNAWNLIQWRSSNVLTEIAVGDGAFVGVNHGALAADFGGPFRLGISLNGVFGTFLFASLGASETTFDDATFAQIRAAIRNKWGNSF